MSHILDKKKTVTTKYGQVCQVGKLLGEGGQGEVYEVQYGNAPHAMKWYYPESATDQQRTTIERLVLLGSPDSAFLWPLEMVEEPDVKGFGYIMPLRPPQYRSIIDLVAGRTKPTFLALITACIGLARGFRQLYAKGLCYRDISFGNVFFTPDTGQILICDNDNVTTNNSHEDASVLGTPDFMAPELILGKKKGPSMDTDLHSLAVLIFYMLHIGHPLQGKAILQIRCWDEPARRKLFGEKPVFIFDPIDASNAAVPGDTEAGGNALVYWNLYPQSIKDTFIRAFTIGLKEPNQRVSTAEWISSLCKLRDSLFRCSCGTPNFYDSSRATRTCWSCRAPLQPPFRIQIGKNTVVMLNHDTKLYPHHLELVKFNEIDFHAKPVAEVVRNPQNPAVWGLKNLTGTKWNATINGDNMRDIDPGRSVPLALGNKINFGITDALILHG